MLVVIATTLLSLLGVFLVGALESWEEVKNNWPEHRCNPFYMPFAEFVNPDVSASDNYVYCTNQMSSSVWGLVGDQINAYFGTLGNTLGNLNQPFSDFRNYISNTRKFMFSFLSQTMSKAANSTGTFIYYLQKFRDAMKRFAAQGYVGAYLTQVMVDFVWSLVTLFIVILKIFLILLLVIAFILALFNPLLLVIAIILTSLIASSGF
jgi:hypothetical protein